MTDQRRDLKRSWLPWLPLAVVFAVALGVGANGSNGPTTNSDRVVEISKTIKCPICAGETVAESNVDISRAIRADIADRVQKGQSDEDVRAFYSTNYEILIPPRSGIAGLVWVVPVVVMVLSIAFLVLAFRRGNRRTLLSATDADRKLVGDAQRERRSRRALDHRDNR